MSSYRRLTQDELTLLANSPDCTHALNSARYQNPSPIDAYGHHTSSESFAQFNCLGLQFMRVARGNTSYTYVWNHPAPITVTGLRGLPMNHATTPHWPGLGHPDEGLAQAAVLPNPQNRAEINAAIDLLAAFASGCSRDSLPVVRVFQIAYNASGLPGQLTTDGEYGPNTQRALQNTMDEAQADAGAGPSQQAPLNCFPEYGQVPSIPALDRPNATPAPATPSGTYVAPVTTVTGDTGKSNAAILLIGGSAAAVAGGLGYWYWKKHKRGR